MFSCKALVDLYSWEALLEHQLSGRSWRVDSIDKLNRIVYHLITVKDWVNWFLLNLNALNSLKKRPLSSEGNIFVGIRKRFNNTETMVFGQCVEYRSGSVSTRMQSPAGMSYCCSNHSICPRQYQVTSFLFTCLVISLRRTLILVAHESFQYVVITKNTSGKNEFHQLSCHLEQTESVCPKSPANNTVTPSIGLLSFEIPAFLECKYELNQSESTRVYNNVIELQVNNELRERIEREFGWKAMLWAEQGPLHPPPTMPRARPSLTQTPSNSAQYNLHIPTVSCSCILKHNHIF